MNMTAAVLLMLYLNTGVLETGAKRVVTPTHAKKPKDPAGMACKGQKFGIVKLRSNDGRKAGLPMVNVGERYEGSYVLLGRSASLLLRSAVFSSAPWSTRRFCSLRMTVSVGTMKGGDGDKEADAKPSSLSESVMLGVSNEALGSAS
jgi:hypothetical protein